MHKLVTTSFAAALIIASLSVSGALAEVRTVSTKPTAGSIERGDTVRFDDKKCPKGQIAQFKRARGGTNINRKCVNL